MKENIEIQYMEETGLVAVSLYNQTVELAIEDINEINAIVKEYGRSKIAKRADFI